MVELIERDGRSGGLPADPRPHRLRGPLQTLAWIWSNLVAFQAALVLALLLMILIFRLEASRLDDLVQFFFEMSPLALPGYSVFLAVVYFFPARWSRRRRRVGAVAVSPVVALTMILPPFVLFGVACGFLVRLLAPRGSARDAPGRTDAPATDARASS